jgi:hypothetical protein
MTSGAKIVVMGDFGIDHILISHRHDFSSERLFLDRPQKGHVEIKHEYSGVHLLARLVNRIQGENDPSGFDDQLAKLSDKNATWESFSEWEYKEKEKDDKKTEYKLKNEHDEDKDKNIHEYSALVKNHHGINSNYNQACKPDINSITIPGEPKNKVIYSIFQLPVEPKDYISENFPKLGPNDLVVLRTMLLLDVLGKFKDPYDCSYLSRIDNIHGDAVRGKTILIFSMTQSQYGSILDKPLSWEHIYRIAKDCITGIPRYDKYYAIVTFFSSHGALLWKPTEEDDKFRLYYYENEIGELSTEKTAVRRKTGVFGVTTVAQAVMTTALAQDLSLEEGIEAGLMMARLLKKIGYRVQSEIKKVEDIPLIIAKKIKFPVKIIGDNTKVVFYKQKNRRKEEVNNHNFQEYKKIIERFEEIKKRDVDEILKYKAKNICVNNLEKELSAPSSILVKSTIIFKKPQLYCNLISPEVRLEKKQHVESLLKVILSGNDKQPVTNEKNDPFRTININGWLFSSLIELRPKDLLFQFCAQIVRHGSVLPLLWDNFKVIPPYLRLGKLLSYDVNHTEQICETYNVLKYYLRDHGRRTPLSICVFGQPGTGKSFTVEEIAKHIDSHKNQNQDVTETLKFNISQFDTHDQLLQAFHQIRDVGLGNKVPLVFFDEFDTHYQENKLGWLRYFLAPMQDGQFYETGQTHIIGRAVFVFAGSGFSTMDNFIKSIDKEQIGKSTDFLSRVRGFIDVPGPNKTDIDINLNSAPHLNHYIRRACLIRSMYERLLHIKEDGFIGISEIALFKLLNVEKYKYGARSLEAIACEFDDNNKTISIESLLKNPSRLKLHLNDNNDITKFMKFPPKGIEK